jgi:antitoxin component of MazEF toxin-antitoxin module
MKTSVIAKWGNSSALRLPAEIVHSMRLSLNDRVYLEVENERLSVTKAPTPKKGTLEYLFKDYAGGSFKTKLINPQTAVGNEKW